MCVANLHLKHPIVPIIDPRVVLSAKLELTVYAGRQRKKSGHACQFDKLSLADRIRIVLHYMVDGQGKSR